MLDPDLQGSSAEEISFSESERVNAHGNLDALLATLQNNPESIPHISSWWDPNTKLKDKFNISEGAGQIRPISRLMFFMNYAKIINKIEMAKKKIEGPIHKIILKLEILLSRMFILLRGCLEELALGCF